MKVSLYQVKLSYCTYGLIVKQGFVTRSAPIARWTEGKEIEQIERWVATKNGTCELVWEGYE